MTAFVLAALVTTLGGVRLPAPIQECVSPDMAWMGPSQGETIALVRGTGRTVPIGPPLDPAYRTALSRTGPAVGYEVVVDEASRVGSGLGYYRVLVPGDTLLVVPWRRSETCTPLPWSDRPWIEGDASVVIRASRVRIQGGKRVLDVDGEIMGYPLAPEFASQFGDRVAEEVEGWLSPRDYFSILAAGPVPGSSLSRAEQLSRLEGVYRTGPVRLTRAFPGPQVLARVREWARKPQGG